MLNDIAMIERWYCFGGARLRKIGMTNQNAFRRWELVCRLSGF